MNTYAPSAKVSAGAIAGASVAAIIFALNYWLLPTEKPIPGELASLVTFIVTSIAGYLTPPSDKDVLATKP